MQIAFRRRPVESANCENGACGPVGSALSVPFGRLFEDAIFSEAFGVHQNARALMALDVVENENAFVVRADLPGFKKDQVSLEIEKGVLILRANAESKAEADAPAAETPPVERYHVRERRACSVTRRIALPEGVQENEVNADLADGVLTVTLPKAPQSQPRKIAIR